MIPRLLLTTILLATPLLAQGSTTYDVSVIHHPKPDAEGSRMSVNDASLEATNADLKRLLEYAYNIRPDLITGIPPALESQHYDVTAKVLDPDMKVLEARKSPQRRAMLVPVLEDRFALKAHVETRELAVYELTAIGPTKLTPLPPGGTDHGTNVSRTTIDATDITLTELCGTLADILHKPVIDKTSLTAGYAIKLKWSPEDNNDPTNQDPPLLTAIQEQLGLKLKTSRGPVPTLVVDHIEPPTEN